MCLRAATPNKETMKKINVSNLTLPSPHGLSTHPHKDSPGYTVAYDDGFNRNPCIMTEAEILEKKAFCLRRIESFQKSIRDCDEALTNPARVVHHTSDEVTD